LHGGENLKNGRVHVAWSKKWIWFSLTKSQRRCLPEQTAWRDDIWKDNREKLFWFCVFELIELRTVIASGVSIKCLSSISPGLLGVHGMLTYTMFMSFLEQYPV